jgi:NodT family efflux transporter outer membrane factor (OMF) lipoprotein
MTMHRRCWIGIAVVALLGGCTVGPAYQRPTVPTPTDWVATPADTRWPPADWWRAFQDQALDDLTESALAHNHDLAAATERVLQARALLQVAAAGLYPNLTADGQAGRQKNPTAGAAIENRYQAGLSASYEIDLFGLNRARAASAAAKLQGSIFDRRTVQLGVSAVTASTYFTLATLDARITVAEASLANARDTLRIVRAQQQAGMATALQVAQQQAEIATLEASLPALDTQRQQARNALAVLAGHAPEGFAVTARQLDELPVPETPAGLPSALLEHRPDVRSAEAALQSATADVRAATAALFPRIDLTAQGGYASTALRDLFEPGGSFFSLMAGVSAPIFEGGQLRGELAYTEARSRELLESYQQSLLAAFGDMENALTAQRNTAATLAAQQRAVTAADTAYRIAKQQFNEGLALYLDVLTTERSLLAARDAEAQARLARLGAAIGVYQALGGGWQ